MSRGIHRGEIPEITLRGMRSAVKHWKSMYGTWADEAAEYWFTVAVAHQLQRQLDGSKNWIRLEANVVETIRLSGHLRPGRRRATLRENGRCDIVVTRANQKPFAAIEVKSPTYSYSAPVRRDVERLRDLLTCNRESSISIACLALYSSASDSCRLGAKATLNRRFETNLLRARETCAGRGLVVRDNYKVVRDEESDDHWGVQCLVLTRS